MNAHVRTIQLAPTHIDAWFARFSSHVTASLLAEPGFVTALALADRAQGSGRTLTIWKTDDDLRAFLASRLNADTESPEMPIEAATYEVAQMAGQPGGSVARVFEARLIPGAAEQIAALFQNIVLHAATAQSGFQRGLLLLDPTTDRALSIGLWRSADDLAASERSGYLRRQLALFPALLAGPLDGSVLEVALEIEHT
jgi:heme-degrading monooxygenase HmoA